MIIPLAKFWRSTPGLLRTTLLGFSLLGLAGCAEPAPAPPSTPSSAPFDVVTVEAVEMVDERWVDGRVEGLQQATVTAQVPGQVSAVLRDAESEVLAGEPILQVRATQAQGGLAQAEAALREAAAFATDAEARYQRMRALYDRQVIPRAAYDQALAQRESAVARQQAARASRDAASAYTLVTAPFAGIVTERRVRVGDSVSPGMPLFGIAATGGLRIRAELPESLVSAARNLRGVVVYHQDQRFETQNILVFAGADARDGSFGLQADLPAPVAGLSPGMVVKVGVATGRRTGLRIPVSAVIERGEVTGAYIFSDSGVRFRQLRLGGVVDGQVEVLAGLTAGERVALRAAEAQVSRQGARESGR
jgi:RND family efflux transporter MFP subunit